MLSIVDQGFEIENDLVFLTVLFPNFGLFVVDVLVSLFYGLVSAIDCLEILFAGLFDLVHAFVFSLLLLLFPAVDR